MCPFGRPHKDLCRISSVRATRRPVPSGPGPRRGGGGRSWARAADAALVVIAAGDRRAHPAIEQANVTYPTSAGPSEQLNVYSPPGPAPPGGWPVIVAIHGGGWRRLDKAGYGDRIASRVRPRWICRGRAELRAVRSGPSELAVEPGRRAIGRGLGAIQRQRAGHRPEPRDRHGRVGRRQPGRAARDRSGSVWNGICIDAGRCSHRVFGAGRPDHALCHQPVGGPGGGAVPRGFAAAGAGGICRGLPDRSRGTRRSADVPCARPGRPAGAGRPVARRWPRRSMRPAWPISSSWSRAATTSTSRCIMRI